MEINNAEQAKQKKLDTEKKIKEMKKYLTANKVKFPELKKKETKTVVQMYNYILDLSIYLTKLRIIAKPIIDKEKALTIKESYRKINKKYARRQKAGGGSTKKAITITNKAGVKKTFESIKMCAEYIGLEYVMVYNIMRGVSKNNTGYTFKLEEKSYDTTLDIKVYLYGDLLCTKNYEVVRESFGLSTFEFKKIIREKKKYHGYQFVKDHVKYTPKHIKHCTHNMPVMVTYPDGSTKQFNSSRLASNELGISITLITNICTNRIKETKEGFKFKASRTSNYKLKKEL